MHGRHAGSVDDLPAARLAVTGGKVRAGGGDVVEEAFADGHRDLVLLLLEAIGPGNTAAVGIELDHMQVRDEREKVQRRLPDAMATLLARSMVWNGQRQRNEVGLQRSTLVQPEQELAEVVHRLADELQVLVLDTEVYSNTGGQASKATPLGAVAKFASAGKRVARKDLALQAIAYGNVYVAQVAMGANPQQTLDAFREAEAYPGPSLILAYSHCIAHGINMTTAMSDQKLAVDAGHWLLYRYNPERSLTGENPLTLDSRTPTKRVKEFLQQQTRFQMLTKSEPEDAKRLWAQAQHDSEIRYRMYEYLAKRNNEQPSKTEAKAEAPQGHTVGSH